MIRSAVNGTKRFTVVAGNTDLGGPLRHVRLPSTGCRPRSRSRASTSPSSPKIKHRHLNYWDTERLYAGNNTATGGLNGENGAGLRLRRDRRPAPRQNLPVDLNRYIVVARALASLGINGIHDQQRQRQQRLPDDRRTSPRRRRWPTPCAPTGSGSRSSIQYTAPTHTRFAPDTLTNAQLDPAGHLVPRLVDTQGASSSRRRSPTSWASRSRPTPRASPARRTSATTTVTGPMPSARPWRRWA